MTHDTGQHISPNDTEVREFIQRVNVPEWEVRELRELVTPLDRGVLPRTGVHSMSRTAGEFKFCRCPDCAAKTGVVAASIDQGMPVAKCSTCKKFYDATRIHVCGTKPKPTRSEMAQFGHEMKSFTPLRCECELCGLSYEQITDPTVPLKCEPDVRWQEYKKARHEKKESERVGVGFCGCPVNETHSCANPHKPDILRDMCTACGLSGVEIAEHKVAQCDPGAAELCRRLARAFKLPTDHTIAEWIAPYRGVPR